MTNRLTISPDGDRAVVMTRVFDAPRRLVFDAWTQPALLRRWLGIRAGWTMSVCDVDLRPDGAYRFVWQKPDKPGTPEIGVGGVYRDVARPERIAYTERFDDPWYPGDAEITIQLDTLDGGGTTSTITARYESTGARDGVLDSPMESGIVETYANLDAALDVQHATERAVLRHAVATLAYRAAKVLRDAPGDFADVRAGAGARSAVEILAHMGDVLAWARSMAVGQPGFEPSTPRAWDAECARFFAALEAFDAALASDVPVHYDVLRLLQGPVADALTHTGQIGMLRRLAGAPVRGESYNRAPIVAGRVGPDQLPPEAKVEFD